jgi:type IV pilus assembly protein PilN
MVRINLLPVRETLRKREIQYFVIFTIAILASAGLVMAGTYLYLSGKRADKVAERSIHKKRLMTLKKKNKAINKLRGEITRLERQVNTINKLTKVRDTPAPFMAAVSLAIPDEVWLSTIQKHGKSFVLAGQGADNTVVVNFVRRLQKVKKDFTPGQWRKNKLNKKEKPFFGNVRLLQTVVGKGGGVLFKIVGSLR